jgi:DNA-binding transcriptional MerR regulator
MEMRVEQLSVRAGVSVDTIRYYQSKGLLDPPRRQGRVAWYGEPHVDRLERIRTLQLRGFTLATIYRLVTGELDAADEALLGELTGVGETGVTTSDRPDEPGPTGTVATGAGGSAAGGERTFTLAELAVATGVPLALLKSIEAEGLLVPRRIGGHERYTEEDVATSKAGLALLEWGIPLSSLLELARRHNEATEEVAREAVCLFSTYVRGPLRRDRSALGDGSGDPAEVGDIGRLVQAYSELLPAVNTLVANHFTRTLVNTALDHVDRVGTDAERRAVWEQIGATLSDGPDGAGLTNGPHPTDGSDGSDGSRRAAAVPGS